MRLHLRERAARWALRRQGPDVLPVTLTRRRLYVLPTRAGLGFALLLFAMLIAGLNYANSLALFMTFLLGGFALVTLHQCHRNLLGIDVLGVGTMPTFAGRPGTLRISLGNPSGAARLCISAGPSRERAEETDVPALGTAHVEIEMPTSRRGVLRLERLELSTTHPFGLFRAWTWIHTPIELVVYPRPRGTRPMPSEGANRSGRLLRSGPGAEEWLGLREFRDGDSPRRVAWKAYARGAPLLVKEYGSGGSEIRIFSFDSLAGLDAEARLEQLARWVVEAEAHGESYGLELPGTTIEPGRGPQHRHRCLTALACHDSGGTTAHDAASV
ncbi:MAG: DUF58 domain-containing protein [Pseudomonadota bacterium]|jgi:uncharacterized protein (DUF58 family)|nr:MAG: DUF58 domain-containing protein [Pseudomonadota bacterium]